MQFILQIKNFPHCTSTETEEKPLSEKCWCLGDVAQALVQRGQGHQAMLLVLPLLLSTAGFWVDT